MIVVDTSVWSLALRRTLPALSVSEAAAMKSLHNLIDEGRVQLLGSVRQELLAGLREETQSVRLRDYLRDFTDTPVERQDYEYAAQVSNQCRRAGISGSPVDMLICAVAIRRNWQILTLDQDFSHYQRVISLQLHLPAERTD
jgi:predicted nucleic acid-binding protein